MALLFQENEGTFQNEPGLNQEDIWTIRNIITAANTWKLRCLLTVPMYSSISTVKIDDFGNNWLHIACRFRSLQMVTYLMKLNPDWINSPNKERNTPAHIASYFGHHEILEVLQSRLENQRGYSAESITALKIDDFFTSNTKFDVSLGNWSRIEILKNHCADVIENLVSDLQFQEVPILEIIKEKIFRRYFDSYQDDLNLRFLFNGGLLNIVKPYWEQKEPGKDSTGFYHLVGRLLYLVIQVSNCYEFVSIEYLGENVHDDSVKTSDVMVIKSDEQYYQYLFQKIFRYFHWKTLQNYDFKKILEAVTESVTFSWQGQNKHDFSTFLKTKLPEIVSIQRKLSLEHDEPPTRNLKKVARKVKQPFSRQSSIPANFLLDLMKNEELNDCQYIKELSKIFPELMHYRYLIDTTPEKKGREILANPLFVKVLYEDAARIQPNEIVEINKLFIRLIYLRDFICKKNSKLPLVSDPVFAEFCEIIFPAIVYEEQLYFLLFSIIADDLGRTKPIVEEVNKHEHREKFNDYIHDDYLRRFFVYLQGTAQFEELLPSFLLLSPHYQHLYRQQVNNTFNLGAWVQGESVPFALYQFCVACPSGFEQRPRLIVQILGFASFVYDGKTFTSNFGDEQFKFYLLAAKRLLESEFPKDSPVARQYQYCIDHYRHYLFERSKDVAQLNDIEAVNSEKFALFRVVALTRTFTPKEWSQILSVWEKLRSVTSKRYGCSITDSLTQFLNYSGFTLETAIYVVYSPSIFGNAKTACESFEKSVFYGLQMLAEIYEDTAEKLKNGSIHAEGKSTEIGGIFMKHARAESEIMARFQESENQSNQGFIEFF